MAIEKELEIGGFIKILVEAENVMQGTLYGKEAMDYLVQELVEKRITDEEEGVSVTIIEADEVKRAIKEMLVENTGAHMLDSGGAYGRNWERNRSRNFDKEDSVIMEVWKDEVIIEYNIYHYLLNFLGINEESKRLQGILSARFLAREDSNYLQDMEDFMQYLSDKEGYTPMGITNTYNYDNIISQVLQYGIVESEDGDCYIILQIHNGCDVRGGYTAPRVFWLYERDYFHLAQNDVNAWCRECDRNWYSDDGGYHWYYNGCTSNELPFEENVILDDENNLVLCKKCGKPVEFSVLEDY